MVVECPHNGRNGVMLCCLSCKAVFWHATHLPGSAAVLHVLSDSMAWAATPPLRPVRQGWRSAL